MKLLSCYSESGGSWGTSCAEQERICTACLWWVTGEKKIDNTVLKTKPGSWEDPLLTDAWWQIPLLQHSWNRLLCMGENCVNKQGCLSHCATPSPITSLPGGCQEGISAWGWWCSSQPFALYLTGDTVTFLGRCFHMRLKTEQHLPLLEGLCLHTSPVLALPP